jgi:bacteriorhodopsin
MKITALFLTIALAQDGGDGSSQSTADTTESYGQEQQSYGEEQQYAPAYAAPVVHAPKLCFQGCPKEAPCYGAGGCQPSACSAIPAYAPANYGEAQTYGEQTQASGYRRLQGYEEGEQQTYGEAQTYSPSYAAAPQQTCGCPAGTVDTSHLSLQSPIILWVAFILLFIPAFIFLCRGLNTDSWMRSNLGEYYEVWRTLLRMAFEEEGPRRDLAERMARQIAQIFMWPQISVGIVVTIASLAYLTMATGHGYITKCNGRAFYYARYVDWFLTTPLMLGEIAAYAGRGGMFSSYIIAMDLMMIVSGLIGELIEGPEKWAFFGFAIIFFLPILWWLCSQDASDGVMCGAAYGLNDAQTLFQRIAALTWIMWLGYPIVWILVMSGGKSGAVAGATYASASYGEEQAYGGEEAQNYRMLQATGAVTVPGLISVTAEAFIYTILDVISKSVFGFLIVFHQWNNCGFAFGHCKNCENDDDLLAEINSANGIHGWIVEKAEAIVPGGNSML